MFATRCLAGRAGPSIPAAGKREARRHTEVARVLQGWPVESVDGEQIAELLQEAGVDVTDAGSPREDTPEASALQEAMDKLALQSDRQA